MQYTSTAARILKFKISFIAAKLFKILLRHRNPIKET